MESERNVDGCNALNGIEIFYLDEQEAGEMFGEGGEEGWYWWACFPGCLPDGEPNGPFPTEYDAECDVQQDNKDFCPECARSYGPNFRGTCEH